MTVREFEQIEQGNPTLGEVVAVLEAMDSGEPIPGHNRDYDKLRTKTEIMERVNEWLMLDNLEPADQDRFDEAVDFLTTSGVVNVDGEVVTVTDKGTAFLDELFNRK